MSSIVTRSQLAGWHKDEEGNWKPDANLLVKKLRTQITRKGKTVQWAARRKIFGVTVHTSGSGVYKTSPKGYIHSDLALKEAIAYYMNPSSTLGGYVIDWETGRIVQLVDDGLCYPHCGLDGWQLQAMADGSWDTSRLSEAAIKNFRFYVSENAAIPQTPSESARALWKARWQGRGYNFRAPRYIYPSKSPNTDYIGIELIPCPPALEHQEPIRYSAVQLYSLCELLENIQLRWSCRLRKIGEKFPTPHLLGHEDLDPFDRWDRIGGWDPGGLRPQPRFPWDDLGMMLAPRGV